MDKDKELHTYFVSGVMEGKKGKLYPFWCEVNTRLDWFSKKEARKAIKDWSKGYAATNNCKDLVVYHYHELK